MPLFNNVLAGAAGQAGSAAAAGPIKSVRFNSADSSRLYRTATAGNRKTFTLSWWMKRCVVNESNRRIFGKSTGSQQFSIMHDSNGRLYTYFNLDSPTDVSTQTFDPQHRDPSAWAHYVLAFDTTQSTDSDRIKFYYNGVQVTDFTSTPNWPTQNASFKWNNASDTYYIGGISSYHINAYLADMYHVDGQQLDCTSFGAFDSNGVWQAAAYSGTFGTNGFHLFDFANESGIGNDSSGNDNDFTVNNLVATAQSVSTSDVTVYRDGAVYALGNPGHMFDSSKSTITYAGSNNATNYIDWSPTGGYETSGHIWIQGGNGSGGGADSMTVTINGSTVTRTAVVDNETYGSPSYGYGDWHKYTVSGNTLNSLRLTGAYALIRQLSTVDDPTHSVLGISDDNDVPIIEDVDPAALDVLFDVPTNGTQSDTGAGGEVSGNYATFNPLATHSSVTLSNGNLETTTTLTNDSYHAYGTIGLKTGKWYCEFTVGATSQSGGNGYPMYGLVLSSTTVLKGGSYLPGGSSSGGVGIDNDGDKRIGGSTSTYGASYAAGDVISMAYDADNGAVYFAKNGTWMNSATKSEIEAGTTTNAAYTYTGGTIEHVIAVAEFNNSSSVLNAGQRSFSYSAPSGFKAICTTNLLTPTIADGSTAFDAKLWTGNTSTQTISGFSFSPDLAWIKSRSNAVSNRLIDTVRGAPYELQSDTTAIEVNRTTGLTAFTSDGFELGADGGYNYSPRTYVGWAWDAGSSTVSNTDGDITSSCRTSTSSGFSIVSWTGNGSSNQTVGHNLGVVPELIIAKNRDTTNSWAVWTTGFNANEYLLLNSDGAKATFSGQWGSTPTSSVFGVNDSSVNGSGNSIIAYCFSSVSSYSQIGTYTGNGINNNGPFVHLNFKPAWVMIKNIDRSTTRWMIYDSVRETTNEITNRLRADRAGAEYSDAYNRIDFLSNGFKIRGTAGTDTNTNGDTLLYLAFAENPFQANGGLAR